MGKIIIIGAGAMGSAFALPCLDNNHDTNIVGTHLENEFIENLKKNNNLHPSLGIKIHNKIKIFKFDEFEELFKSKKEGIILQFIDVISWLTSKIENISFEQAIKNRPF